MHTPLFERPIATQSLGWPQLSQVLVSSIDVTDAEAFNLSSEDFQYKALVIKYKSGSPITSGEFVAQLQRLIIAFDKADIQAIDQGQHKYPHELKVHSKDAKSKGWEDRVIVNFYNFVEGKPGLSSETTFWKR